MEWSIRVAKNHSGVGALTTCRVEVSETVEVEILRATTSDALSMATPDYLQEGNSLFPRSVSAAQTPR